MKDKRDYTMYQLLADGPGDHPADQLRYAMAHEALSDTDWRLMYDMAPRSFFGFPENLPSLTARTSELPTEREPDTTLLNQWLGSPPHCVSPLRMRAVELGIQPRTTVHTIDTIAAVIGAELWCSALAIVDLTRASSLGGDSVSSLAAIMARASGYPVLHHPDAYTEPVDASFDLERLDAECARLLAWAGTTLGAAQARIALEMATRDLTYRAFGESMTSQAAMRVRQRYLSSS